VRRDWPPGILPLGNAAAALEPIGGEGMGLAMRSAELVATEVADALRAGRDVDHDRLLGQFDRLWRLRRAVCRAGAMVMSRRWMAAAGVSVLRAVPAVGRLAMTLAGKTHQLPTRPATAQPLPSPPQ
jgi:2-polyprenyl-6-methoxyphenol hydroxylase-like FAD-dependent oxidoreductase